LRRELGGEVGDALNGISSLLGGSTEGRRGKPDTVSRARTINAVLTLQRRHRDSEVARHVGSLTMGAAIRRVMMYLILNTRERNRGTHKTRDEFRS
jgi:hypothetical protein